MLNDFQDLSASILYYDVKVNFLSIRINVSFIFKLDPLLTWGRYKPYYVKELRNIIDRPPNELTNIHKLSGTPYCATYDLFISIIKLHRNI